MPAVTPLMKSDYPEIRRSSARPSASNDRLKLRVKPTGQRRSTPISSRTWRRFRTAPASVPPRATLIMQVPGPVRGYPGRACARSSPTPSTTWRDQIIKKYPKILGRPGPHDRSHFPEPHGQDDQFRNPQVTRRCCRRSWRFSTPPPAPRPRRPRRPRPHRPSGPASHRPAGRVPGPRDHAPRR